MEKNGADRASAEVAINRLHGEKDTLQKALSYMEERLQVCKSREKRVEEQEDKERKRKEIEGEREMNRERKVE